MKALLLAALLIPGLAQADPSTPFTVVFTLALLASDPGTILLDKKVSLEDCLKDTVNFAVEAAKAKSYSASICMTQKDAAAFAAAADCHDMKMVSLTGMPNPVMRLTCNGITAGPK